MDITLRQIKYFIAAAETGKIATAANMLSISPSSITESIKELESITGVRLITRHRRGINLTFDGYRFLQHPGRNNHCRRRSIETQASGD